MGADKGFKKAEGFNQDDNMENERGKVGPEDHGWAPDSGAIAVDLGWRVWFGEPSTYPGTVLLALEEALDDGRGRRTVSADRREISAGKTGVKGSPHLFLPDGTDSPNPRVTMHWVGDKPGGIPRDPGPRPRCVRGPHHPGSMR